MATNDIRWCGKWVGGFDHPWKKKKVCLLIVQAKVQAEILANTKHMQGEVIAFHSSILRDTLPASELQIRLQNRILTADGAESCGEEWCHGHGPTKSPVTNESVERGKPQKKFA